MKTEYGEEHEERRPGGTGEGRIGRLRREMGQLEAKVSELKDVRVQTDFCKAGFDQEIAKERIRLKKIQMFSDLDVATDYVREMSEIAGGQRYDEIQRVFREIRRNLDEEITENDGSIERIKTELLQLEGEAGTAERFFPDAADQRSC